MAPSVLEDLPASELIRAFVARTVAAVFELLVRREPELSQHDPKVVHRRHVPSGWQVLRTRYADRVEDAGSETRFVDALSIKHVALDLGRAMIALDDDDGLRAMSVEFAEEPLD